MRKVVYGGACSLDGYLTGPAGEIDWIHFSKDVQRIMEQSWANADTVLFGRKTWDGAAQSGGGGTTPGVKSYVFSRTLSNISQPGVTLVREDAGAFVRELKSQPGKDIIVMSGGDFARSLLRAGVIDEIGLNVHPVLLGGGTPAFAPGGERVKLTLTESRTLDGGCVLLMYRVAQ